jgi:hypothetical protein
MSSLVGTQVWISVRGCLVIAAVTLAAYAPRPASAPPRARPQAAVLGDGFAAIDGDNRVVELDREGVRRHALVVRGVASPRIVGIDGGLGAVWRDGRRVAAADVDRDGNVGAPARFGKSVQRMCLGTASNVHRFAVGWTEADGAVWIVFGPTSRTRGEPAALEAEPVTGATTGEATGATLDPGGQALPTFCAVASAERKIALVWASDGKVSMSLCDRKCATFPTKVALGRDREVLGVGCVADACVIATRRGQAIEATWVSTRGKIAWTRPLRDAVPDTAIELVGTGTQVAIAYATPGEPVVVAAARTGELAPIWQGPADDVPSIQWADGRLVVVRHAGDALVSSTVRVP